MFIVQNVKKANFAKKKVELWTSSSLSFYHKLDKLYVIAACCKSSQIIPKKKCTHSQYNCNKSCERGKDLDDKLMLNYDSDKKARREGAGKKCEKEREKKKPGEADLPLVTRTRSKKT